MAEPDSEPVDDLDAGDEAEAEEETEEAADLRDEVYGGHTEGTLELENCRLLGNRLDHWIRLLAYTKKMDDYTRENTKIYCFCWRKKKQGI